jgi:hypothetical protein
MRRQKLEPPKQGHPLHVGLPVDRYDLVLLREMRELYLQSGSVFGVDSWRKKRAVVMAQKLRDAEAALKKRAAEHDDAAAKPRGKAPRRAQRA